VRAHHLIAVVVATVAAVAGRPVTALALCERPSALVFPLDELAKAGSAACYATRSDVTTRVQTVGGNKRNRFGTATLVEDKRHCRDGARHGQECRVVADCPGGSCVDAAGGACRITPNGKVIFFIFNGNPTGNNADLGDELFHHARGTLTQVTNFPGTCANDTSRQCTTAADCTDDVDCERANLSGLQVGKHVFFVKDGDLYGGAVNGNRVPAVQAISEGGGLCADNTANRGQACTTDEQCGAECGNGLLDSPEQCDGGGCSQGQFCAPQGSQSQCTCQPIICGNGRVDPGEECDGSDTPCSSIEDCQPPGNPGECQCVITAKPTCGNGRLESGEQCDTSACPPFQTCDGVTCQCVNVPAACGDGILGAGEQCDGAANPCRPGFTCNGSCLCVASTVCGNAVVESGEECDPPGASCGVGLTCDIFCDCDP
jgi:hypothetical protein